MKEPYGERWKKIYPAIAEMVRKKFDDSLPNFAQLVAKLKTSEIKGHKGIIFSGITGCGKSTRMEFVSELCNINIRRADVMVLALNSVKGTLGQIRNICNLPDGAYGLNKRERHREYDLIIDDLGIEVPIINLWGTKVDAMQMMLMERLEMYPSVRTFATTNLTTEQIRERYGDRIFSRLLEQTIFLPFKEVDHRAAKGDTWMSDGF